MKLSVLIPMHNAADHIERCLDSLLNQGLNKADFEILIIDDESTDNSVALVEKYRSKHTNIHLFLEKNVGAYSTRNKLLKLAKGAYLYCIDADDYLAHHALCKILDSAFDHQLEIIGFSSLETKETDLYQTDCPKRALECMQTQKGTDFMLHNPKHRLEIWWYLVRRDFLEESEIIFCDNEYNADVLFTIKLFLKAKRVGYCPIAVHRYYQSSNSLMRNDNRTQQKKLLINFYTMILDLSEFIDNLQQSEVKTDGAVVQHLCKRRDDLLFSLITRMVGFNVDTSTMKNRLGRLKSIGVYPTTHPWSPQKNSAKHWLLGHVLNRESLLYPAVRAYRIFADIR